MMIHQAQPKQRILQFTPGLSVFEEFCPNCCQRMTGEIGDRRCTNTAAGCEIAREGIVITDQKMAGELYDRLHPEGD